MEYYAYPCRLVKVLGCHERALLLWYLRNKWNGIPMVVQTSDVLRDLSYRRRKFENARAWLIANGYVKLTGPCEYVVNAELVDSIVKGG